MDKLEYFKTPNQELAAEIIKILFYFILFVLPFERGSGIAY